MHLLKIYVDSSNQELKDAYIEAAKQHNTQQESLTPDSGFDLLVPGFLIMSTNGYHVQTINFQVKCALVSDDNAYAYSGYYLYPRSSLSSTPLRLANSVGIIDSGYRGHIKAAFDTLYPKQSEQRTACDVSKFTRLVQLCAPDLGFMRVVIVDSLDELGGATMRCEGGFGSTGGTIGQPIASSVV